MAADEALVQLALRYGGDVCVYLRSHSLRVCLVELTLCCFGLSCGLVEGFHPFRP
jgi:hypothetical protein